MAEILVFPVKIFGQPVQKRVSEKLKRRRQLKADPGMIERTIREALRADPSPYSAEFIRRGAEHARAIADHLEAAAERLEQQGAYSGPAGRRAPRAK